VEEAVPVTPYIVPEAAPEAVVPPQILIPSTESSSESSSESTTSEQSTKESSGSETTGSETTGSETTGSETTGSESTTESTGSEKSYKSEVELSDEDENTRIVVHVVRNQTEIPPIISWTCFVFMLVQLVRLFKLLTGGSMEVGPGYYGPCY
jgi:cobalamin biosynthesis Mg chelatase CobN